MLRTLRYGIRQVKRNRAFSTVVIALLALGIGANTLVFSLVNELLLKPLPVRDPQNLYLIQIVAPYNVRPAYSMLYTVYRNVVLKGGIFSAAVAEPEWSQIDLQRFSSGGATRLAMVHMVSPNYFTELGIQPILGRVLTPDDANVEANLPAVLSYQFWQSQFSGDRSVIGRTVRIKDTAYTVVGVLPREFHSTDIDRAPDVRVPFSASRFLQGHELGDLHAERGDAFRVLVRLPSGVSPERAAGEFLPRFKGAIAQAARDRNAVSKHPVTPAELEKDIATPFQLSLIPAASGLSQLRDQFAAALWVLLGGVALLLLAVCANVAGLLLVKSGGRRKEIGVRMAVGASRGQLIRQLLVENLMLAIPGAAAGALLAYALAPSIIRLLPPPRDYGQFASAQLLTVRPDLRVLLFTAAISILCVLVFGLLPAWRATRLQLHTELKAARSGAPRGAAGVVPVAVQVLVSVVLLAAAGLMLRTFRNLDTENTGFDRAHIVTFTFDPGDAGYTPAQSAAFYRELRARVGALPGVHADAWSSRGLMRGVGVKTTLAPRGVVLPSKTFLNTSIHSVSTSYFDTLGLPILAGRNLVPEDATRKPKPIVANRAFADLFFPHQNPIGKFLAQGTDGTQPAAYEVVGLVPTAKYRSMREPDPPTFYSALDQNAGLEGELNLCVRTYNAPASIISAVRDTARAIDPGVPLLESLTLEHEIQTSMWQERLVAILAAFFSVASVLLAAIGLYGALAQSLAQRTREFGIRVAIGARLRHLARALCIPVAISVGCGLAAGVIAASLLLRVTAKLLYGVEPFDLTSLAAAAILILLCVAAAASVPLRRAGRIDPSVALREE